MSAQHRSHTSIKLVGAPPQYGLALQIPRPQTKHLKSARAL
jgi:hypothetical protein